MFTAEKFVRSYWTVSPFPFPFCFKKDHCVFGNPVKLTVDCFFQTVRIGCTAGLVTDCVNSGEVQCPVLAVCSVDGFRQHLSIYCHIFCCESLYWKVSQVTEGHMVLIDSFVVAFIGCLQPRY